MLPFLCDLFNKALCRINQCDICPLGLFSAGISVSDSIPRKSCSQFSWFQANGVFLNHSILRPSHVYPFLRKGLEKGWHWAISQAPFLSKVSQYLCTQELFYVGQSILDDDVCHLTVMEGPAAEAFFFFFWVKDCSSGADSARDIFMTLTMVPEGSSSPFQLGQCYQETG